MQPTRGAARGPGAGSSPEEVFVGDDETQAQLRATDWAATSLGPTEGWSRELGAVIPLVMRSRVPMLLWWGPDLVQMYNDAARQVLGSKHPGCLGRPAADCFPEVWPELGFLAEGVRDGEGVLFFQDLFLPLDRYGYIEETYWTFSCSPVWEGDSIAGVLVAALDTTAPMLDRRRMGAVHQLSGLPTTVARSVAEACRIAFAVLERARADVPFGLVHLLGEEGRTLDLVASFGTEDRTVLEWTEMPGPDGEVPSWRVTTSGQSEEVTFLRAAHGAIFEPSVLGDAVPDTAVVLPLLDGETGRVLGSVALGVSPYRALDESYRAFFDLVAMQLSTACTDALILEREWGRVDELSFALAQAEDHATHLERALSSNRDIGAAMGILMHQHRITEAESFDLLRKASQRLNLRLRAVADQVILTGQLPPYA